MENDFEIIEKVVDFTGKKGKLQYNSVNLANRNKRVMLRMISTDKKKEPLSVLLSSSLSADFRDRKIGVGHLMGLSYGKTNVNGDDVYYICQPQGTWEDVNLADYDEEEIPTTEAAASIEELLASI